MVKGYTKIIDDEFVSVVLSNQMYFNREGYLLQQFTIPDSENYPGSNSLPTNIQKYINRITERKLEVYKHAMRDIEAITTEDIISTKYMNLVQSACSHFVKKGYSHENLMEFCTDVCAYTRCAYMKKLNPSKYWTKYFMAEALLLLRLRYLFSDESYGDLDEWLSERVSDIERNTGHMDLSPIELSLEWVNYPPPPEPENISLNPDSSSNATSCCTGSYDGYINEGITERFETRVGQPETSRDTSKEPEDYGYRPAKSEALEDMPENSEILEDITGNSETNKDMPEKPEISVTTPRKPEIFENTPRKRKLLSLRV